MISGTNDDAQTMMIVDQLVVQHQTLRNKASEAPDEVNMNEVLALMDQVQAASAHVENSKQREQLQAILFHWNGYVHTKTGAYPGTKLADYSPAPTEENTGRVTTTKPDIALPKVHWGIWLIAILLFLGGALIIIIPRASSGSDEVDQDLLLETTRMVETAVAATQTSQAAEITATAMLEIQATTAAEALQVTAPVSEQPTQEPNLSGPYVYTVQAGDTLFGIARNFNTTVNDIMVMNGLATQSLSVGQTLVLPNPPLTPEANASPTVTAVAPAPSNNEQIIEIVIRANTTPLYSGPGADFSEIMTLDRGTFIYAVGRDPAAAWFLVQLEDGVTRGWVTLADVGLLYPTVPESIPVITTP